MAFQKVKREEDYSKWYNNIVTNADLAEHSSVRGCMVIKPYGYAIWEKMQQQLDKMFKETGHSNAYFPLFVPKSLFEAEETNAEGFAKECAIVTHYRLKSDPDNKGKLIVDPDAKLEEELIVRPTSEAIIWNTYKGWIQSYRDLPLLINQWANVVRWEMRTRLFLRTTNKGAIIGALASIPIAMYFKVAPKGWSTSPLFVDVPFMNQMGYTLLLTMLVIALVSYIQHNGANDKKAIDINRELFKTSPLFNIGAFVVIIILTVLYAMFWK